MNLFTNDRNARESALAALEQLSSALTSGKAALEGLDYLNDALDSDDFRSAVRGIRQAHLQMAHAAKEFQYSACCPSCSAFHPGWADTSTECGTCGYYGACDICEVEIDEDDVRDLDDPRLCGSAACRMEALAQRDGEAAADDVRSGA